MSVPNRFTALQFSAHVPRWDSRIALVLTIVAFGGLFLWGCAKSSELPQATPTDTAVATRTASRTPLPRSATPSPTATLVPTKTAVPSVTPSFTPSPTVLALSEADTVAQRINLSLEEDPTSLDPALVGNEAAEQCAQFLFLGLTDYDERTLEVVPALATEWHASDDGLTWTFTLRRDVEWVQYDPVTRGVKPRGRVTAHDVVYGVRRALGLGTAASRAYVDYVIKGAEALHRGESDDPESIGVRAVDDYTVEFTLEHPAAYFPMIMAMDLNHPVPQQAIEQYGEHWAEPGNIWTNGPYLLDAWEPGQRITLRKNPYYYDAPTVGIELVNWLIADIDTAAALYERGELDVALADGDFYNRLRDDPARARELSHTPQFWTMFLGFNTTKPPFDNVKVRQAFAMALDRQGFVKWRGFGDIAATSFAPPGIVGSPAEDPSFKGMAYDPKRAKQLLAEAGFPNGKGMPEITLGLSSGRGQQAVAEFWQRNLQDNLGVRVRLIIQDWEAFMQTLDEDPPHLFYLGMHPYYPDENDMLLYVHPRDGMNRAQWDVDAPAAVMFMALYDKAAITLDPNLRKQYYALAEKILVVDEAIIAPLFYYSYPESTQPYIRRTYARDGIQRVDKWTIGPPPTLTPTPTTPANLIEVVIREYSYSQWGRPAGMDDPQKPCGDFNDRRPVRKLTASLTVYNKSDKPMRRWTAIFVKPNGKRAYTCIQGYDTLPVIPPGRSCQVTFSVFIEPNETIAYGVISDADVGTSNMLRFR